MNFRSIVQSHTTVFQSCPRTNQLLHQHYRLKHQTSTYFRNKRLFDTSFRGSHRTLHSTAASREHSSNPVADRYWQRTASFDPEAASMSAGKKLPPHTADPDITSGKKKPMEPRPSSRYDLPFTMHQHISVTSLMTAVSSLYPHPIKSSSSIASKPPPPSPPHTSSPAATYPPSTTDASPNPTSQAATATGPRTARPRSARPSRSPGSCWRATTASGG